MADRNPVAEIERRVRGYAQLRAAERAILSGGRFRDCLTVSDRARDVLAQLRSGLEHLSVDSPELESDLAAVDETLRSYSHLLLEILEHTSIASFRATLPATVVIGRDDVIGLLDLCLQSQETALGNRDLIAYLVTLLSTRTENGLQTVVGDPATVTRRLRSLCVAVENQLSGPGHEIEAKIRSVTESILDLADLDSAVCRVRSIKKDIGFRFFLPPILRALVEYNVTISNRLQALLDQDRTMDKEFLAGLGV